MLAYFKLKFEHRYSVPQVIFALEKYTDLKNDIPTPADILAILNPQKPRISEAAYVAAQKWQERNGYPVFSDAKTTIEEYERQHLVDGHQYRKEREEIEALKAIGGSPFQRLT